MFTQGWSRFHLRSITGELRRTTDSQELTASRLVHFHNGTTLTERLIFCNFLHAEYRTTRYTQFTQFFHNVHLLTGNGIGFHRCIDFFLHLFTGIWGIEFRIVYPFRFANRLGCCRKRFHFILQNDVHECTRVLFPTLASIAPTQYLTAFHVTATRYGIGKGTIRILRHVLQYTGMFQNQLVTKFHTAEVDDRILHGLLHEAPFACLFTLHQGCQDTNQQVHPCITVAQGCSRLGWDVIFTFVPPGCSRCSTGTLCHRLKCLDTGERGIVIESLNGSINHTRIDLVYLFPREA